VIVVIDDETALRLVVFGPKALIWGAKLGIVRVLYKVFDQEFAIVYSVGVQRY
jgi:hypothetical protein